MRSVSLTALLSSLVLLANWHLASAMVGEGETLKGEWVLLSTQDEKRVSPGSEDCKMVIAGGGQVTIKDGDRTTNQGTIKITRAGKANCIDLKVRTGLFLGVYELKGEDLVICFNEAGKPRPAGMKPTGSQWAEQWQRVKPRPAICVPPPSGSSGQKPEGP